jgi:MFS transporter, DHA2 family, multidrug resistance protein
MELSAMIADRRWWALLALVPAVLAVGLDATVLAVALPTLATHFGASTGELQWFVVAYTLAFAAALVPGGMLGDRYGRKRFLLLALVVFGAGSVACALAPNAAALIAARVVLGLGGAVVVPMALAALPLLFDDKERPRAMVVIMAGTMLGFPIGPVLGGWLLTHAWWGWVFLINVPVVGIALGSVAALLPESRAQVAHPLDLAGAGLSAAGLTAFTYGVIQAGELGWASTRAAAFSAAGLALLGAFVARERQARAPLVEVALFRARGFATGTALATILSFVMFGLLFAAPLYFEAVLGTDAQGGGLRLLPLVLGLLVAGVTADRLVGVLGGNVVVATGFAVTAAGLALGAGSRPGSGDAFALTWVALTGLGIGLALPTAMDAALGAVADRSADSSGAGSALLQAARMVGGSLGAALLGSLLDTGYRHGLAGAPAAALPAPLAQAARGSVTAGVTVAGRVGSAPLLEQVRLAFLAGMSSMLWVCAGIALAAGVLAALLLPRRQPRHARPSSGTASGPSSGTASGTAGSQGEHAVA